MAKNHTSFGKSDGKERLRNLLYEALAGCKTRGTTGYEAEMRGYVHENPSLGFELEQALSILNRLKYQSESISEQEIERF